MNRERDMDIVPGITKVRCLVYYLTFLQT